MGAQLAGRVAVVTGGGGSIGRAVALTFARHGASVLVSDYGGRHNTIGRGSVTAADKVVAKIREMGGVAIADYSDVTQLVTGENIVNTAVTRWGRLDILFHAAGIARNVPNGT
ncbi:MAG: SDR family NAD(P)-dependent oxidoreductase [SAR202 cluster bacterium]|nr:SDR family NAD(P)-dependent oxidoreductase [SAR202 cluster bacterium]